MTISYKAARQKGKALEDYVADQIVAMGLDPKARRDGGSGNGNREKGDVSTSMTVLGQNVGIECKNHKTLAIPDWWRQTKKLEGLGREPVLAYKLPGDGYEGTLVTIYLDTFLRLCVVDKGLVTFKGFDQKPPAASLSENREQEYALEQLKRAVRNFQKHFPGVIE